jgi:hypothetical protein
MLAVGFSSRNAPIAKTRGIAPVIKPAPGNMAAGNFACAKHTSDGDQNRSSTSQVAMWIATTFGASYVTFHCQDLQPSFRSAQRLHACEYALQRRKC